MVIATGVVVARAGAVGAGVRAGMAIGAAVVEGPSWQSRWMGNFRKVKISLLEG